MRSVLFDFSVKIPKKFAELDADGSGELDYDEFCQGFGFDKTPLTHKLFDAFDQDCSGNINIVEVCGGGGCTPPTAGWGTVHRRAAQLATLQL